MLTNSLMTAATTTDSVGTSLFSAPNVTSVADAGRVRMGNGCRVQAKLVVAGKTVDSGKVSFG